MKLAIKILVSALALGSMVASPLLRAEDEKAPPAQGRRGGGAGRQGGRMSPEARIEGIEKAVGTLSAEQKSKITDILAKQREQFQASRAGGGGGGDREAGRGKMQEAMKATNDQIRAVLTPEQQKKFDEMSQGRGAGGGGRRGKKGN